MKKFQSATLLLVFLCFLIYKVSYNFVTSGNTIPTNIKEDIDINSELITDNNLVVKINEVVPENNIDEDLQVHKIASNGNHFIRCNKGTGIFIPKNSFIDNNGKTYDSINFYIKEYYGIKDYFKNKLYTVYNREMLVSGGTVHLKATSNDKELVLKKGKKLYLFFPKRNKGNDDMLTFYGEKGNDGVEWKNYEKADYTFAFIPRRVNDECKECKAEVIKRNIPEYKAKYLDVYCEKCTNQKKYYDELYNLCDSALSKINLSQKEMEKHYKSPVKVEAYLKKSITQDFFHFRSKGVIDSISMVIRDVALKYYINLKQKDMLYADEACVSFKYTLGKYPSYFFDNNFMEAMRIIKDSVKRHYEAEMLAMQTTNYVLGASKLGWINCDRFYDVDNKDKTDFIVKHESKDKLQMVCMAFPQINGLLKGEIKCKKIVFSNVPKNTVVHVIAIKRYRDKTFFALHKLLPAEEVLEQLEFSELNEEEMDKKLASIDAPYKRFY